MIMVDHQDNSQAGAAILGAGRWRCVWFDELVAVFVHDSYKSAVAAHQVDFGARHFRPDPAFEPRGLPALVAEAKGLRNYVNYHGGSRADLARPMIWLGLDYARRVVQAEPDSLEGWKSIGIIEMFREPLPVPSPRFRMPFDPVFDLSPIRSTSALRRAAEIAPRDFLTLIGLQNCYQGRQLYEPLAPVLDAIVSLHPINPHQASQQVETERLRADVRLRLGSPPATAWKNLGELDQMVEDQLSRGRAESAAALQERAYPPGQTPWAAAERLATLYLHLGDPARARAALTKAGDVPRPALRDARLAVCELAEGRLAEARQLYKQAIEKEPGLFEARYGLAVVEQDDGRAEAAYEQALAAVDYAPGDAARTSARVIAAAVGPYARERGTTTGDGVPRAPR
jgi:Flp pilus assembly protein TadD